MKRIGTSFWVATLVFFYGVAFGQTFNGLGGPIADLATTDFPLSVSGLNPATIDTNNFGLETVCINLTHTYDSDLRITLISPDGTSSVLIDRIGGGNDNFTNTCLNHYASTPITAGQAPFTGTFSPQSEMGRVNNGQNGNGNWILRVEDLAGADTGSVQNWALTFGNNPATYLSFSSSNMPIVVINTNGQTIQQTGKITADMGIIYNGPGIRNNLTDPYNNYSGKVGIEIRGNYSASLPQKPYEFETRDLSGANLDTALLGMPSENDWTLIAMYNDKSFMRNTLSYDLFDRMGHWGPRSKLCEVVLNGDYQGVYALTEKIKRDPNRVDIAKLDPTEVTWPDISGGYILKTDYHNPSNSWQSSFSPIDHPGIPVYLVYVYPKPDEIVQAQRLHIQNFIFNYETALYGTAFADTSIGYRKYLSVRSFYDYFIINELSRNVDGFKKSAYYYKEKDKPDGTLGKLKAGPVWDFDWAWKDIWDCTIFQATDGSGWSHHINDCNPDINGTGWYVRLLQDSSFANELNCRWTDLRGNLLDTTRLFGFMDSIANYSNEAQQRHYALWGNMGNATGTPEVNPPAQSYAEEVENLKSWIRRRIVWLDANMFGNNNNCNLVANENSNRDRTIHVYPNPFSNALNLQIAQSSPNNCVVEIFDALGARIGEKQHLSYQGGLETFEIALPNEMPKGVYFLKVSIAEEVANHKLLKLN